LKHAKKPLVYSFLPTSLPSDRAVVSKVDGPAKPTDIERIIYALELWMKRIENGIPLPLEDHLRISGWQTRWSRMKKVSRIGKLRGDAEMNWAKNAADGAGMGMKRSILEESD